jgi:hypothetical protein
MAPLKDSVSVASVMKDFGLRRSNGPEEILSKIERRVNGSSLWSWFLGVCSILDGKLSRGWLLLDVPVVEEEEFIYRLAYLLGGTMRAKTFLLLGMVHAIFLYENASAGFGLILESLVLEMRCRQLCLLLRGFRSALLEIVRGERGGEDFVNSLSQMSVMWVFREKLGPDCIPRSWRCLRDVRVAFANGCPFVWKNRACSEPFWLYRMQGVSLKRCNCDGPILERMRPFGVGSSTACKDVVACLSILANLDIPLVFLRFVQKEATLSDLERGVLNIPISLEKSVCMVSGVPEVVSSFRVRPVLRPNKLKRLSPHIWHRLCQPGEEDRCQEILSGVLEEERWKAFIRMLAELKVRVHEASVGRVYGSELARVDSWSLSDMLEAVRDFESDRDFLLWGKLRGLPALRGSSADAVADHTYALAYHPPMDGNLLADRSPVGADARIGCPVADADVMMDLPEGDLVIDEDVNDDLNMLDY